MATEAVVAAGAVKPKEKKRKGNQHRVNFWAIECKYSVILDVVTSLGWKLVDDERMESKVNLFWIDVATIHERFRSIQPWQMINHFPGMPNIARKNRMGQNLNRMQRMFPKEYSFYPRTWILPSELNDFRTQFDSNGVSLNNKIFIIKPDAGCQGRGIFLTRTMDNVPVTENVVAQVYIKKPLLLDNYKFDLRIYVYVAGVKPLRLYLFHDGLVRMCTEEYVKPTKQNLNQMCMHLTNYAVNKHNNNFAQPASIEDQDHSSKRSLQWFMQYLANNFGDAKANWVWRRIGVLCTRTVLSILPTLSREYDSHFKSFNNVPVDIKKIPKATSSLSGSKLPQAPGIRKSFGSAYGNRRNGTSRESGSEDDDEEDHHEDEDQQGSNKEDESAQTGSDGQDDDPLKPKIRGSRCFEILGFDIMIDANLNPTLIEVNHLPSFGTDSALDLDIKDRLMQQVFQVLPTMSDDYTAYAAHMKVEAERRQAEKLQAQQQAAANEKKILKSNPPPRRREASTERKQSGSSINSISDSMSQDSHSMKTEEMPLKPVEEAKGSQEQNIEIIEEECTPERLEEIKRILKEVYSVYSPEKISKIDRLLHKYLGHEEEFLRFVFAKYNVSPSLYEKPKPAAVASDKRTENTTNERHEESQDECSQREGNDDAHSVEGIAMHTGRSTEVTTKRYSRSLSPPRNKKAAPVSNSTSAANSNRRMSAAWKTQPDEDAQFKAEVFKEHIPNEDEEWMKFEMTKLSQFTRIFPPLPKSMMTNYIEAIKGHVSMHQVPDIAVPVRDKSSPIGTENNENEDEEDNKEEEDDDENNNGNTANANSNSVANSNSDSGKKKSASYEEIIYQVFLQDRRQTMRLRCPLPNRAKADENSSGNFLPPLDAPSSSRSSMSSIGSGRGVVGWKAPPKPQQKEAPKQPTVSQLESAKRLSQGLSVASVAEKAKQGMTSSSSVESHNIVLDPVDYSVNPNGLYTDSAWTSTKANRLYEESRRNRMRVEAQRNSNGAVLRQQIFFFDPTYENIAPPPVAVLNPNAPSGLDNLGSVTGGMNDSTYAPAMAAAAGSSRIKFPSQQPGAVSGAKNAAYWQGGNANVIPNPGVSANGPKQEELLKQLFPSWF